MKFDFENRKIKKTVSKNRAFTLAETLITLGIIGIVAAITIPNLMNKYFEIRTVSQLKEMQSIISQAVKMSEEEYGEVGGWGLTGANKASAVLIAERLTPYLKVALDCGVTDSNGDCAPNYNYKFLSGTYTGLQTFAKRTDVYKITLMNGVSLWWRGGTERLITFWVDVNGTKLPNTYGKDLFVIVYENDTLTTTNSIRPLGAPDSDSPWEKTCSLKTGTRSGYGCAYYVIMNHNMNYLH